MTQPATESTPHSVEIDPEKLREERQERGLSQIDLGKLAGVSNSFICNLENGLRPRVSPKVYVALCDALGIPRTQRRKLRKSRAEAA